MSFDKPKKVQSVNQLTSISLGTDRLGYETTYGKQQKQVLNGWHKSTYDPDKLREQKQALQRSNLRFGDQKSAWGTSSKLQDPTGNMAKYRGVIAAKEAKELRSSHIDLGTANTKYQSSASSQNQWAKPSAWALNRSKVNSGKEGEVSMMERKTKARKVNFTLGDEPTGYTSLMRASFADPTVTSRTNPGWQPPTSSKKKSFVESSESEQTEMLLDDLRGAHFSFGTDRSMYVTSGAAMNGKIWKPRKQLSAKEMEQVHERKKNLVKSNLCLGDSRTSYMSTAMAQQRNHPSWRASEDWEQARGGSGNSSRRRTRNSRSQNQRDQ